MEADDHFDAQDSTAHNEHRHDAEPNKPEMADNQEDLAADSRRADDKMVSDHGDEESGEDTARPSAGRPGMYSDDDDESEDEEDEEMTEADKQFIVDDAEDEEVGSDGGDVIHKKRRRKRKKRASSVSESDLDEDDLDLLDENSGGRQFKRLRRKAGEDDVAKIFSDEDEAEPSRTGPTRREFYDEDDDMDDFIIDDEEGEGGEGDRAEKLAQRRKEKAALGQNLGRGLGISDEQWRDVQHLFGFEEDYNWAMEVKEGQMIGQYDNEDDIAPMKEKEIKLTDVYEPSEIAAKLMTEADEDIRLTDIPERFQLRGEFPTPRPGELSREALYVVRRLWSEKGIREEPQLGHPVVDSVTKVLDYFRGTNKEDERYYFEVPFICEHRKDYVEGLLDATDLWRVYDLDVQFIAFEERKRNVESLFKEVARLSEEAAADNYVTLRLDKANSMEDIMDMLHYIQLKYGEDLLRAEQVRRQTFKRAKRKTPYDIAKQAGIGEFVKLFQCDGRRIASEISAAPSHIEDPPQNPLQVARKYVSSAFPKPEDVLQAARMMLATEIAAEPSLRAFVRNVYDTDGILTVTPTKKGSVEIDPFHPYYPFKYLARKLLCDFSDGQFLQILAAEEEGLITTDIRISAQEAFLNDALRKTSSNSVNEVSQAWNMERKKVLEKALIELLFPQVVKYEKERLGLKAAEYVALECYRALQKKINVAPFKRSEDADEDEWDPRVMAISWGDGDGGAPTFCVVLNETGEILEWAKLDKLRGPPEYRAADAEIISSMIARHEPDVIAIAGFKPNTKTLLHRAIQDIVQEAFASRKIRDDLGVIFVEDDVARIFMNSKRGLREFPDTTYPPLIRYLVSLGRRVQDPTTEFAGLMDMSDDIKYLRLHPEQHLVPEEKLRRALERAFINVVNRCGVDINLAAQHPHRASTLQFVAGLGPRKAQAFISQIHRSGGRLEARAHLIRNKFCGQKVFMNCSAFIRIRSRHFARYEAVLDVLDDTRVHPEDYDLARKMAADALDYDDAVLEEDDNPSVHVAELMESEDLNKLTHLALDEFAVELERRLQERKKLVLIDITKELIRPFGEPRNSFEPATVDEVFHMLTNETDETLKESSIISVQIVRVMDRLLKCRLQSGLDGLIHIKQIPLERNHAHHASLMELFREDTPLQAKVLRVDKEKMLVELSLRDVDPNRIRLEVPVDKKFDRAREADELAAQRNIDVRKAKAKQVRVIKHPYFKPLDYRSAQQYLADKVPGSVVIRPSTKGNDHFSITWKVDDKHCQHIDVIESDKENEYALGKVLIIEGERYSEIDQIIAEHIEPTSRRIQDTFRHPKFQRKSLLDMKQAMEEQCSATRRSAYGLVECPDKPCHFFLVFKHPQDRPHHEYVVVNHKGYLFRKKVFDTIDAMLRFFKEDEARRASAPRAKGASGNNGQAGGIPPPPGQYAPPLPGQYYRIQSQMPTSR